MKVRFSTLLIAVAAALTLFTGFAPAAQAEIKASLWIFIGHPPLGLLIIDRGKLSSPLPSWKVRPVTARQGRVRP